MFVAFFYKKLILLYFIVLLAILISVVTIFNNPLQVNFEFVRPDALIKDEDLFSFLINRILIYRWCFFYKLIIKGRHKIGFKAIIFSILLDPKVYIFLILNIPVRLTKLMLVYIKVFILKKSCDLNFNQSLIDIFFPQSFFESTSIFYNGSG